MVHWLAVPHMQYAGLLCEVHTSLLKLQAQAHRRVGGLHLSLSLLHYLPVLRPLLRIPIRPLRDIGMARHLRPLRVGVRSHWANKGSQIRLLRVRGPLSFLPPLHYKKKKKCLVHLAHKECRGKHIGSVSTSEGNAAVRVQKRIKKVKHLSRCMLRQPPNTVSGRTWRCHAAVSRYGIWMHRTATTVRRDQNDVVTSLIAKDI